MPKKSFLFVTALLSSHLALAVPAFDFDTDWEEVETDWYGGFSISKMNPRSNIFKVTAKAEISFSTSGEKGIFFTLYPNKDSFECSEETKNGRSEKIIFYVNNQAIKGLWYCLKYADSNEIYYGFNGATEAGRDFTVNAFKKSETVAIDVKGERYIFSADGFTGAWNAKGGDAL